jgi:hypothetical protein
MEGDGNVKVLGRVLGEHRSLVMQCNSWVNSHYMGLVLMSR